MYQRLRETSLWEGEPLDESSGRPLTHDILAALNLMEPNEEEFIEQPRSSSMLEEPGEDAEDGSAESSQEIPRPMPSDEIECERVDCTVYLLLGPSTALYLQWVCGGLDALVRQSSTPPFVGTPGPRSATLPPHSGSFSFLFHCKPNAFLNCRKGTLDNGFVSPSAICLLVSMYFNPTVPSSTFSLT